MSAGSGTTLLQDIQIRRGRLPETLRIPTLIEIPEGSFRLGVIAGGGVLFWDPWGRDHPHILVTGTTGSGKSRVMEMLALQALAWGWDVGIIDYKGGGDYWAAMNQGAEVYSDPVSATKALVRAADLIEQRNALMRELEIETRRGDGSRAADRATSLRGLRPEVRALHELRPMLLLIDETASILDDKKSGGMAALRRGVQLGRSAGVHLVIGLQRPDADLLPGFIKHNVQARVLLGPTDREAEQMVLGSALSAISDADRLAPRPPGRGLSSGVGGLQIARFQAFLLSRDPYLPDLVDPAPSAGGVGGAAEGAELGVPAAPLVGDSEPLYPPHDHPPFSPREKGDRSSAARVASDHLTVLLRGSVARRRLRRSSRSLRRVPEVAGGVARDPGLRARVLARDGFRCAACSCGPGDGSVAFHVDHVVPLWAGGSDTAENAQVLCVPCHNAKTAGEAAARAQVRAAGGLVGARRPGATKRVRRLWPWVAGTTFAAGLLTQHWVPLALLTILLVAVLPRLLAYYAVPDPWKKKRQSGLDGVNTWDVQQEMKLPGGLGPFARWWYGVRNRMILTKYQILGLWCGAYLLGVGVRAGWVGAVLWWALTVVWGLTF